MSSISKVLSIDQEYDEIISKAKHEAESILRNKKEEIGKKEQQEKENIKQTLEREFNESFSQYKHSINRKFEQKYEQLYTLKKSVDIKAEASKIVEDIVNGKF
jgi:F0F1-type ATP synthase membrane subunit b/b'